MAILTIISISSTPRGWEFQSDTSIIGQDHRREFESMDETGISERIRLPSRQTSSFATANVLVVSIQT
jgi:hypothetical protein